jgi:hypothetical protein
MAVFVPKARFSALKLTLAQDVAGSVAIDPDWTGDNDPPDLAQTVLWITGEDHEELGFAFRP